MTRDTISREVFERADAAYDLIDRFLRNNLDDADYAEYSAALEVVRTAPQPSVEPVGWIACRERLPELGKPVAVGRWVANEWIFAYAESDARGGGLGPWTHWYSLPAPPADGVDNEE